MDAVRIGLAVLTVLGFALTVWGLKRAWDGARDNLHEARERARRTEDLGAAEDRETAALDALPRSERTPGDAEALIEKYRRLHDENGYRRPAGYGESHVPGGEAAFVFESLLDSTRGDLILAAVGLTVSTLASVLSLFLV